MARAETYTIISAIIALAGIVLGSMLKLRFTHFDKRSSQMGLDLVQGHALERNSSTLPSVLDKMKRNLLIDFGEQGMHLPDVDMINFNPGNSQVLAIVSVEMRLRERVAQTGYWKMKLASAPVTLDIKVYFITPDEDGTLVKSKPAKKGRAIVEVDTDGGYVMSE